MNMSSILITNAYIVNEGRRIHGNILIEGDTIKKISQGSCESDFSGFSGRIIDATGKIVIPGIIDTHVHFRQPGLTYKADMHSESIAAAAGGVTTVMDMPNTDPMTVSLQEWEKKNIMAESSCVVNYSFFIGATCDNIEQISKIDPKRVCGVKLFMGSSTGNMLVDDSYSLSAVFAESPVIVSAHCEDESIIRSNTEKYRAEYPNATAEIHPRIRPEEACYRSSAKAVELADKYGAKLNIAHITTSRELSLFDKGPVADKKISAEACIAHLWFCDKDYARKNNFIKCNPSIKTENDRDALRNGLLDNKIDLIATDHAPHTTEEKLRPYWSAPSGMPMIQHSLCAMLNLSHQGILPIETVVEKMCHAPAIRYEIADRGFLRSGYKADIVIINPAQGYTVTKNNILYKCGWSPMEGESFDSSVDMTIINGRIAFENGKVNDEIRGQMLSFRR